MPTPTAGDFYASRGWIGYGTQVLVGSAVGGASPDGSPDEDTYTVVGYVRSVTPGSMESNIIDRTHLRSIGAHREKTVGLRDSGPFALVMDWLPDEEAQSNAGGGAGAFASGGLLSMWRNREERNFRLILPDEDATEWDFVGAISQYQPGEIGLEEVTPLNLAITPLRDVTEFLP